MNVQRALSDVAEIRAQLDRTADYRGFRSLATGFSALFVLLGAIAQTTWLETTSSQPSLYLTIWLAVAVASSSMAGLEMIVRGLLANNGQVWLTHRKLIGNLMPSLVAGSVLTLVIGSQTTFNSTGLIWALPGTWAMLFGVGLFACRNELPRPSIWVARYFLVAGIGCLLLNMQTHEVAAWQMVALFGLGQSFLGLVLYWNVERKYG